MVPKYSSRAPAAELWHGGKLAQPVARAAEPPNLLTMSTDAEPKRELRRQQSSRRAVVDAAGDEIVQVGCFSRFMVKRPWVVALTSFVIIVALVAWPHPLVVKLGIVMSCIGAALQSLTSAPRLLTAIAADDLGETHAEARAERSCRGVSTP